MVKTLVVIPARYGSSRFPGKPLAKIAGKEMLLRARERRIPMRESWSRPRTSGLRTFARRTESNA